MNLIPHEIPLLSVGITSGREISFSLSGAYTDEATGELAAPGAYTVSLSDGGVAFLWQGRAVTAVTLRPSSEHGDTFSLKGVTIGVRFHWQRVEEQAFRGALKLMVHQGAILAVNIVDVETYLESVIAGEMNANASTALLEAHAVISRSWVMAQITKSSSRRSAPCTPVSSPEALISYQDRNDHTVFDVCADDHCQRYQGILRSGYAAAAAVAATRGQILTYGDEICDTRFSKCCGGIFERFETCWDDAPRPYLQPRLDAADTSAPLPDLTVEAEAEKWIQGSPRVFCNTQDPAVLSKVLNGYDTEKPDFFRWSETIPAAKLRALVAERLGRDLGDILALTPLVRGSSGRIRELKVTGTLGEAIVGKELAIRRLLSDSHLRSSAFVAVAEDPDADGVPARFRLTGAGWGHGVGLCQIGAAMMGELGYSYREILAHYYIDSKITQAYV